MNLEIPHLTYSDIGQKAKTFLLQYHPTFEIPIPIEDIIDVGMGLNIFPFPRLYKDFGLNGFLSKDRTTIYVDEIQYEQFNEKYRFTLAHEIGHYILHEQCYSDLPFKTPDEYFIWRNSIPSEEISYFETQADWFAGQLLVPTIQLEQSCKAIIDKYLDKIKKITRIPDDFWSYASNEIARHFEVNPPVIEIRIRKEKISEKIKII